MTKKYDLCARLEIQGKEKPAWPRIGMTLTVKDDGKISLYDSRTGISYFAFERKPRDTQDQVPSQSDTQTGGDFDDDIPF